FRRVLFRSWRGVERPQLMPDAPPHEPGPAPRRRDWRGGLGMAIALVLAFVWGGIADQQLAPSKGPRVASAAVAGVAVLGSQQPPQWIGDFASGFCKADAQAMAPRIGPPLTNNVEAISNALSDRDWDCSE